MSPWLRTGARAAGLAAVALSSASGLVFEIALTRVFSITQFYHFAFMTVSLALLGLGASGSVLAAFPGIARGGTHRLAWLALGQAMGTLGAYALANALPFDSFSIAWDARQVMYLWVDYLGLVVPFFFGGLVVGAMLSSGLATREDGAPASHHVYAASLAGSGAGGLLALAGLAWFGGVGVVCGAALLAVLGAVCLEWASGTRRPAFLAVLGAAVVLGVAWTAQPPAALELRLSPYKELSGALRYPGARIAATQWNASSRVDLVESDGIRSLPGLSFTYSGAPPPQAGVTFDGDDLSAVPLVSPGQADFAPYLLAALPYRLRPGADALVLEPRGGLEVLVALANQAGAVRAVEPNELVVALSAERSGLYRDPRVEVIIDEPRAFVERDPRRYDVISLALTAPYRPVTSGAYSLGEDYRLTVEAFERYLAKLKPGGLLAVMRWLQTPPSEEMRLIALADAAVRRTSGVSAASIAALRGYANVLVLVKGSGSGQPGFTEDELAAIRAFADERRFDLIAAPGLSAADANRYNRLPDDAYHRLATALLAATSPQDIYAAVPFDITPPTDDHPFFAHFFRWEQAADVWASLGKTWQPFGGAGYFVLILLLGLATAAALALIVAPLAVRDMRHPFTHEKHASLAAGKHGRASLRWTVAYFGLLGIGFLFVEIPLIQQYILLVGRPTLALAAVLLPLLVASGMGSLMSRRVPWRLGAVLLVAAVAVYPSLIRWLSAAILTASVEWRLVAGSLLLIPLGFLMGTMFPRGIAYLENRAPRWVPWAWGINGAASVISAVASALVALTFGFSVVFALGAVCYGVCGLLVKGTNITPPRL